MSSKIEYFRTLLQDNNLDLDSSTIDQIVGCAVALGSPTGVSSQQKRLVFGYNLGKINFCNKPIHTVLFINECVNKAKLIPSASSVKGFECFKKENFPQETDTIKIFHAWLKLTPAEQQVYLDKPEN